MEDSFNVGDFLNRLDQGEFDDDLNSQLDRLTKLQLHQLAKLMAQKSREMQSDNAT